MGKAIKTLSKLFFFMHDIAIIQGILDAVLEKARGLKPKSIKLHICIGALKFVEPENANFWLEEMLKKEFGSDLKLSIKIETIYPEIKCKCGFEGTVEHFHADHDMMHAGLVEMACPKCKSEEFDLVKGKEVLITEMEFE